MKKDNETKTFSIDEICALVEMNKRTVRFYIQKGLVDRPEGIGKGAYYSHTHLEQLLSIRKWKTAGLSLERIQSILASEKQGDTADQLVPPPLPTKQGTVEVWSHLNVGDGIELQIEPKRAGLRPEQVRALFKEVMNLARKIRERWITVRSRYSAHWQKIALCRLWIFVFTFPNSGPITLCDV